MRKTKREVESKKFFVVFSSQKGLWLAHTRATLFSFFSQNQIKSPPLFLLSPSISKRYVPNRTASSLSTRAIPLARQLDGKRASEREQRERAREPLAKSPSSIAKRARAMPASQERAPLRDSLSPLSSSFSFFFPHANDLDTNQSIPLDNSRARKGDCAGWRLGRAVSQSSASTPSLSNSPHPPSKFSLSLKNNQSRPPPPLSPSRQKLKMIKRVIVSTLLVGCVALGKEGGGKLDGKG